MADVFVAFDIPALNLDKYHIRKYKKILKTSKIKDSKQRFTGYKVK